MGWGGMYDGMGRKTSGNQKKKIKRKEREKLKIRVDDGLDAMYGIQIA